MPAARTVRNAPGRMYAWRPANSTFWVRKPVTRGPTPTRISCVFWPSVMKNEYFGNAAITSRQTSLPSTS